MNKRYLAAEFTRRRDVFELASHHDGPLIPGRRENRIFGNNFYRIAGLSPAHRRFTSARQHHLPILECRE